jgi:hypothetical protein
MKKITGVLTPILAIVILLIAGCETEVDPVGAVNNELNTEGRTVTITGGGTQPRLNGISSISSTVYNLTDEEFEITFAVSGTGAVTIDADPINDGAIEIRQLAPRTAAAPSTSITESVPSSYAGPVITPTVVWVNKNTVRLRANFASVNHTTLEVHVIADKFTANNGLLKFNLDGDFTPGEAEDDVFTTMTITSAAVPAAPLTVSTPFILQGTTNVGINTLGFGSSLPSGLLNQYDITIEGYADTEDSTYSTYLTDNLKIDKYENGNWQPGAVIFTIVPQGTAPVYSAGTISRTYRATFTSANRDILRARLEKYSEFTTANAYFGKQQKFTWADNAYEWRILTGPTHSIDQTPAAGVLQFYTDASIVNGTASVITADSKGTVYVKIPLDASDNVTAHAALQEATVTNDKIKIVATVSGSPVNISWESFIYEYGVYNAGGGTYVSYPSALLLKLSDSYKIEGTREFKVYITPEVLTAASKPALPTGAYFLPGIYNGLADEIDDGAARL